VTTGIDTATTAGPDPAGVVYHGYQPTAGGGVITVETADGTVIGVLRHYVRHSPTGFSWGYGGSGPAETARCLLLAALDDPRCPACRGTGQTVLTEQGERPFDPDIDDPLDPAVLSCMDCDRDRLRVVPHQQFKWQFVAGWTGEWRITRAEIREWLTAHGLTP
jgi:hypothetical protein